MQWRALVMLLTGMAVIYLVSLLQDKPHPFPAKQFMDKPIKSKLTTEPTKTILKATKTHVFYTLIWHQLSTNEQKKLLKENYNPPLISNTPLSANYRSVGYIRQYRRPLELFLTNTTSAKHEALTAMEYSFSINNENKWELVHECLFNGPIISHSSPTNSDIEQTGLLFGVLYNVLSDENIQHWVRIYYTVDDHSAGLNYKDVLLPGSTWVSAFTLEANAILYSRDPDFHQFRWLTLPKDFKNAPHSENADPIIFDQSQPGVLSTIKQDAVQEDPIVNKKYDLEAESHRSVLTKLISPIDGPYYTFSFNLYKTPKYFYEERYVADNITIDNDISRWFISDLKVSPDNVFYEETLEHMTYGDGVHFQHERIEMEIPDLYLSRSKNNKVIVLSSIKNRFYSLVWEEKDGKNTHGTYKWKTNILSVDDYSIKINGIQVDDTGNRLAVWTNNKNVYIFDREHYKENEKDLEEVYGIWIITSVITPMQGESLNNDFIDSVLFLSNNDGNYILVGRKKGAVNSYNLDRTEPQKPINFWSFLIDQWQAWLPMSIVTLIFVFKENSYVV
ncbi:unnamed protein product [Cunninghamella blakesleeana]